jgi:hypothetical protein
MQCLRSFHTAERTLEGLELMHMLRKGQVKKLDGKGRGRSGEVRREPLRSSRMTEFSKRPLLVSK